MSVTQEQEILGMTAFELVGTVLATYVAVAAFVVVVGLLVIWWLWT